MGNSIDIPIDDFLKVVTRADAISSSAYSTGSSVNRQTTIRTDEQPYNLENVTLLWLDRDINFDKDDSRKTVRDLREINNFTEFYTDPQCCINYINTCDKEKIFIIISGSLTKEDDILSQIQSSLVIHSIFIFCQNSSAYENLLQSPKVVGIFTKQAPLMEAIKKQIQIVSKQIIDFSIFDKNEKTHQDLTNDSGSFLRFQLLFGVLKDMPPHADSKDRMLEICEKYYHGKQSEKKYIENFRRYKGENAITWYTEDCFVYRLLNKALRTEDIDGLLLFHFFIIDLCKQLEIESQHNKKLEEQCYKESGAFILYRGQQMSEEEIEKFERSEGSLISPNGFFSTSVKKQIALNFANNSTRNGCFPVLFEIEADNTIKSSVYAYIEHLSSSKTEFEVLFSLGTVFKVYKVVPDRDNNRNIPMYTIKMGLTDEGMNDVKGYVDSTRNYYEGMDTSVIFGRLLIEMDEIAKAEKYFNLLLKSVDKGSLNEADILDEFGHIALRQMKNESASEYFKRARDLKLNHVEEGHPKIALSINNYGVHASSSGQPKEAIRYFQQTLDILENYNEKRPAWISNVKLHLGGAYMANQESEKALEYLKKSLKMQEKVLPKQDCNIADILSAIGYVYYKEKLYDDAKEYFFKALEKYEKTLPAGHKKITNLCRAIVYVCKAQHGNVSALDCCEEKLNKFREKTGENSLECGSNALCNG